MFLVWIGVCFCLFVFHWSHSSTSLGRNLKWATMGFSPLDTFHIFSTSQKLTRKIVFGFHHFSRPYEKLHLLITNFSWHQISLGLKGCSFSCVRSIFPPTLQECLACCYLLLRDHLRTGTPRCQQDISQRSIFLPPDASQHWSPHWH